MEGQKLTTAMVAAACAINYGDSSCPEEDAVCQSSTKRSTTSTSTINKPLENTEDELHSSIDGIVKEEPIAACECTNKYKSTSGKWKVSVFTSELPSAGTTSQVYITFYGHKRASEPVFLDSNEGEEIFQSGNEDTFFVNIGDIGEIYKIRIGHSNSGISPAWHCEEVQLLDLFSNEQFCIKVNRWLARDQDDGEICRELPVLQHGHAKLPVTKYELRVVTGDLWNAGTEANVYISVHGEYGDTGSRQLFKSSKPMKFVKRQTDTFSLESVHLGDLQTVIIGHDGLEPGNGWYLEKIVIHDPVKDKEYTFFCYRWLDEGEDDRNIVRKLYVADESEFPARQELELKKKQIWSAERWKFQKGNTLHFYCKATRKFIRLTPDGKVDALAEKKDKYGFFDVTAKRGNVRVFNSHHISHLALAIDKGIVTAMDNSGILCELQVHLQLNRCVILESTRVPGLTVSFSSDGDPANGNTSGYARISKEFVVHVKGMFHHGAILLLTTSWSQALCIRYGGHCSGAGNQNEESYWRVHKISSSVYMFESVKSPMQYLRIKNGKCDGEGRGDEYCQFKVEKNLENGSVTLESVRNRGIYVGLLPTGLAKPVVQTGESNVMFFPKVIKFGREKPMGTSATPSLKKEEINKDKDMEEQGLVARSPSVSPSLRKREEATLRSHEDSLHRSTEWKVLVLTGSVGTSASVTLWVYGSKGTSGPITLGNDNKEQLFLPRQEDEFMVKMPNIGKLYKIRIEHDGTNDQSEWKLKHINLQKMKTGKTYSFEVNRWLSRTRENCDIVYELPAVENGEFLYPIVKYQVNVYTGLLEHADTDAPVYICIYGERGDSGRRILYKSNWPKKFQKGQVDVFEIEAVSLGKLHQVLLGCEANQKSQYWYCEKVIIREQGKDSEYIFSCERWLPFMSQNILQSHIKLPVQELQTSKMKEHNEENEGDWKITVVTGSLHQAATDATVFLYVYGEKADSGPIILGSGEHQLFDLNSSDTFKINLSHIGKIYKLRIGHDSSGNNPIWYLEEVKLKNIASNEEFHLPVNRWLGEEKDDGDTWRELPLLRDGEPQLALLDYKIYVYTGSIPDAGTESNVYINLFGTRGDSGKRKLHKNENQQVKFQKGQVDIFCIQAVSLGMLKKIQISHDGTGPENGWFLDKVKIKYTEDGSDQKVLFPCNRWLDICKGDRKTEIELFAAENENPEKEDIKVIQWNIQVKTAKDSLQMEEMKVKLVIYGSEGKSENVLLLPPEHTATCFLPGSKDEFIVESKNVGKVYKIRVTCNIVPVTAGWHLKFLRMIELKSQQEVKFDCDCWLSVGDEDEIIKEFPAVNNGQEQLPVYKYIVAVHTGDHWGAETAANVYVTLYGERGDSGPRKLHKSLAPGEKFTRNKTDLFILEVVSLGDLRKVVLGHDGEGYGAGMYLKMVTAKESRDSTSEWVFPFWNWLDSNLGMCQTVCKLHTIGRRLCSNPKPHANSGGLWVMDITGCEFDSSASPVYFSIVFFGDKGKEKLKKQIVGNTIQMKEELKSVGSIYKVQICWSNIQVKKEWHLISMHLKQTSTNQEMWLNFDCWMKSNEDSCVELPAIYPDKDPLPVVEYVIYIHTGDVDNTKTSGKVCISIEGENGDTGKRVLNNAGTEVLSFTKGQVDIFRIKAVHLGKLQRIVVGFSNSRKDMWFLEKIIVKEEDFSSTSYVFIYNDWITCKSDTEFTESVIMLKELKEEPKEVKSFSTVTRGQWQMQVLDATTEEKNHDISVVVYGRTGKSQPQRVKKLNYNPFMIQVGDIGEIIKVSFQSMAPSFGRRLQLQKIRLKDVDTKQEIGFYPDLSDHQDSESVIELAAVLPDVSPLANVSYSVRVKTGSIPAAGTDADVSITIYGENGDMCKRKLKHSSYPGVFEKGQVNIFNIKAVDLGMLTKVYIEHNAVGFGAGWYLDQIVIQESDKGHPEFLFPCQQWLDTGISGKQTSCELKLLGKVSETNERLRKSVGGTFNIFVTAVNVTNGAIKNQVYLTICCEKGHYEPVVFTRGSLKEGTTFQSTVDLNQNLGPIQKIRLQMDDNVKGESWYCKEVKLQHRQSKETLEFPFLRNFKSDGNSLVAELPVLTPDRPILTVKTYTVYLTTAKSSEKNTDTNFFITLQGSLGDSGRRKPCHGDSEYSIRGKAIGFQLEAVDIGEIQEMIIEKETKTNLQLEKAVVEEGTFIKTKYIFITQKWKNEKKMMSMTLQVTEVKKASITESLNRLMASDGEWNIYLTTSNKVKEEEITETLEYNSKLVIVLYGNKGKSTPFITESKADSPVKDMLIYKINLEQDLGELYKMRLGLENWREDKGGLSVYHLKMQNTQTLDTFSYSNKAYPLSFYGDRWIEVPIEWPLKVSLSVVQYHVTLFYTDIHKQKDGLDLSVCLHGENGDSGDRRLTWQNSQERNEESFTATFDAVDLGEMHHADISMSSKNDHRLNIKYLHVKDLPRNELYRFVVNKEFSVGANESEIREEVLVSADVLRTSNKLNRDRSLESDKKRRSKEQPVEHLIKVYTGDVTGAGTDANVHIVLFSEQDSFGPVQLTQSLEQQNPFERGKVDTFKIKTTNLGKISHIEIGHDGKGVGSGWFLDKIEIVNMSTKEETLFSCNRWLAEDENDGKTVIRLFP